MDGAYFGGHVRPENRKQDRLDRRLAENQTGKRQCVVVVRERAPDGTSLGRTIANVFKTEDAALDFIKFRVDRASTVHADEAGAWNALHARFETKRVNQAWRSPTGGSPESSLSEVARESLCSVYVLISPIPAAQSAHWWRLLHKSGFMAVPE